MKRKSEKKNKIAKKTVEKRTKKPAMACTGNVCIPEPAPKCPHCGYGHVILKNLPGCPMCKVCSGCKKRLMECDCIEGE